MGLDLPTSGHEFQEGAVKTGRPLSSRLALAFQIRTKWIPLVNGETERGPR